MRREEFEYEKSRFTLRNLLMLIAALTFALVSCEKDPDPDPDPDPEPEIPEETLIINQWIWEGLNEVYLWEEFIPYIDYRKQDDPEEYFYRLLYEDDRDSWIVKDYDALVASFEGVELSTGMDAQAAAINEDNDIVFVILYVTPDSPAEQAGVKRGDIIVSIDGEALTPGNYIDLYYSQTTANYEFGSLSGPDIVHDGRYVEITAIELNQNPVLHREVIEYEGARIGYLVYTQFTAGQEGEWLDSLNVVFDEFSAQNVTDVVVDLRYNPGGSLGLSGYIASTLAPASVMENNEVFVRLVWNDLYNDYWMRADLDEDGSPDGENSDQLLIRLSDSEKNLNLSKVYFLTTDGTASASESVIIGLDPYMDVVKIGTKTYGKCYGSFTIDDWETPKRHNWAMQPIVIKYANAEGFTDFVNGLTPDYVESEYLRELAPFGSFEDPLLARALEDITGVAPSVTKSAGKQADITPLPVPRKRVPEWITKWPGRSLEKEIY
jgi:C-terminal processing protease CtpA/Prc